METTIVLISHRLVRTKGNNTQEVLSKHTAQKMHLINIKVI